MTTFPLQLQDLTKRDWGIWLRDPQHEINILPSIWQFFLPDAKLDLAENATL